MTRLALLLALLAASASANENVIDVQHDSRRGVTCWILNGVGISCIPDSQIKSPTSPARNETPDSRGLAPTFMWENEQSPTTVRWDEERYSL